MRPGSFAHFSRAERKPRSPWQSTGSPLFLKEAKLPFSVEVELRKWTQPSYTMHGSRGKRKEYKTIKDDKVAKLKKIILGYKKTNFVMLHWV
ncbi:hypothetical protein [Exiguobacterium artemiae]|uniref:hypothetical protein n=1 Tax=Exiguobacterium artemiae TaxID=340145 RepID=UPI00047B12E8|nr:hypothetical protein [Exiguobacterium sibiricum]